MLAPSIGSYVVNNNLQRTKPITNDSYIVARLFYFVNRFVCKRPVGCLPEGVPQVVPSMKMKTLETVMI